MTSRAPGLAVALFLGLASPACSGGDDAGDPTRANAAAAKAAGDSCSTGSECDSGFCVDGVCCTSACTGPCQACAAAKKQSLAQNGACGPALEGLDPHDDCSADPAGSCGKTGACDGKGACALTPQGVACTSDAGAGNACVINGAKGPICSGGGVCYVESSPAGIPCAPYVCKSGSCAFPCAGDGDCQSPNRCENGVCKAKRKNGDPCSDKAECDSGNCTDGVCCDTNCSGQCQACNLAGKVGTCAFVLGAPVAPRPDCSGTGACKGTCGGNGDKCTYPGAATACGNASCTGDVSTAASTCDGTGACAPGASAPCTPYGCDATSGSCKKTCAGDTDCAQGGQCDTTTGKCAVTFPTCKDATTVRMPNGQTQSCEPYGCKGGKCLQQCASADDCAPGYDCAGSACVAASDSGPGGNAGASGSGGSASGGAPAGGGSPSSESSDDGGCGCSAPGRPGRGLGALALGALGLWVRRRRAR